MHERKAVNQLNSVSGTEIVEKRGNKCLSFSVNFDGKSIGVE